AAVTKLSRIAHWRETGDPCAKPTDHFPSRIRAAVIDNDDFVFDCIQTQLDVKVFDGRGDRAFLIASWYDNRKQAQRLVRQRRRRKLHRSLRAVWTIRSSQDFAISRKMSSSDFWISHAGK